MPVLFSGQETTAIVHGQSSIVVPGQEVGSNALIYGAPGTRVKPNMPTRFDAAERTPTAFTPCTR